MSVWTVERVSGRVTLTYTHEPLAPNPLVQPCGVAEAVLEADVEAWVFEQAAPWDIVRTPRGVFVRQRASPERRTRAPNEAWAASADDVLA